MERKIVKGADYCAVLEDGILVEYIPEDRTEQCGAILLGKTDRLMPGMGCAFVDIGRKRSGFLPLAENGGSFTGNEVRSGEMLTVQVRKEEIGEKGAFLSRDVTLPGELVILMPMNRYIGVSSRIPEGETRDRLKETGTAIAGGRFGLVMRNAASEAGEEAIREETDKLYDLWKKISEEAKQGGKPGRILFTGDTAERLKEDYAAAGTEETVPSEEAEGSIRIQLKQASERKLTLPGGGNIVIDRCEAMTVIDVNTASSAGCGSKERTVIETNLEACTLIAQQVRLRNLGGIILIDFIDMDNETDRGTVFRTLSECFSRDRIKTVIHGWTKLGIMEMTRKRTRSELFL